MASSPASLCCISEIEASPLTFPGILSDPLIRDLMKADHVDPVELTTELTQIAEHLGTVRERPLGQRAIRWQRDRAFRRSLS